MYGQEMCWVMPGRKRRICAFSDFHFCGNTGREKLDFARRALQRACQTERIDYIFCLGDLINSGEVLEDSQLRRELESFLSEIAELAPLVIVTGNHELKDHVVIDSAVKGGSGEVRCDDINWRRRKKVEITNPQIWYDWARSFQHPRIHFLDEKLGEGAEILDDGVARILGMTLPAECYGAPGSAKCVSAEAFRKYAEKVLPRLTAVPNREYYLLLHSPQHLGAITLDPQVTILAGHMHNGMVPPGLDELLQFSERGLVGPGCYNRKQRKVNYDPLAKGARYRPSEHHNWLTLNSCAHFPAESWLRHLDGIFPAFSYAILTDGGERRFTSRYFRLKLE